MKFNRIAFIAFLMIFNNLAMASIDEDKVSAVENVVKDIAWEAIESSSKDLISQLIQNGHQAESIANELLTHAAQIEKGAISASIHGTSEELKLAASKWMKISVELKDSAAELKKIPKSDAAKEAAWLGANVAIWKNVYDNYQLLEESTAIAQKYPAFDLSASPTEYYATTATNATSFGVGLAVNYLAKIVIPKVSGGAVSLGLGVLLTPNKMGLEVYDLMPSNKEDLRKWVVFMDSESKKYAFSSKIKDGTSTDVPGGLIQYLQIMDKLKPSAEMAWVHNWNISGGIVNGQYKDVVKTWTGSSQVAAKPNTCATQQSYVCSPVLGNIISGITNGNNSAIGAANGLAGWNNGASNITKPTNTNNAQQQTGGVSH